SPLFSWSSWNPAAIALPASKDASAILHADVGILEPEADLAKVLVVPILGLLLLLAAVLVPLGTARGAVEYQHGRVVLVAVAADGVAAVATRKLILISITRCVKSKRFQLAATIRTSKPFLTIWMSLISNLCCRARTVTQSIIIGLHRETPIRLCKRTRKQDEGV
ncbi:uncharacterized protein B0I36DRAFT_401019, partial [Microdochium trichocladiopsis]